jgi:hypothetical protein
MCLSGLREKIGECIERAAAVEPLAHQRRAGRHSPASFIRTIDRLA